MFQRRILALLVGVLFIPLLGAVQAPVAGAEQSAEVFQTAAANPKPKCTTDVKRPRVCGKIKWALGHRGHHGAPESTDENTKAALLIADRAGLGAEIDARSLRGPEGYGTGKAVLMHDKRLGRAVDHDSLYAVGLTPDSHIGEVTLEQFRQLRSRGGQPLLTLKEAFQIVARRNMRVLVDTQGQINDPVAIARQLEKLGTVNRTIFYQLPQAQCRTLRIDDLMALGLRGGWKHNSDCEFDAQEIADGGYELVTARMTVLREHASEIKEVGLLAGAYNTNDPDTWRELVNKFGKRVTLIGPKAPKLGGWVHR